MLSLQELSDRIEIEQLIVHYANSIDQRNWDGLDQVFTPDAYIDYRKLGGIDGRYPQIKAWLGPALAQLPALLSPGGQHRDHAGRATRPAARTLCINPMDTPLPGGGSQVMFLGLWYLDKFIRTPAGWRMTERVEEGCFQHNVPAHMAIPAA